MESAMLRTVVWTLIFFMFPLLTPHYQVSKTFHLGGEGGWDYLALDSARHRLFITRATHVMVVDPDSGRQIGDIPDTPGVHGVALAPELGRGFTSNGQGDSVSIFDLNSLKVSGTVKVGKDPDAIVYDPASKRVFTFNGESNDTTAIDAAKGTVVGTMPLDGNPEFAVPDGRGRMYVNIYDKDELLAFDTANLTVLARWPVAPCKRPSGLAMDAAHRRLFVGCRSEVLAVVNADTGAVVKTLPIGPGVDSNRFDPATQLAFSSNGGDGTLTVIHEDSPDKYKVVQNLTTARGARTMDIDLSTHKIYLVTAEYVQTPVPNPGNPNPRAGVVPDTFELLVVSPDEGVRQRLLKK
jgi:DNA-binding beta-propeller fold protein YncE